MRGRSRFSTGDLAFDSVVVASGRDALSVLTAGVRRALLGLDSYAELDWLQARELCSWVPGRGDDPARLYGAVRAQVEAHQMLSARAQQIAREGGEVAAPPPAKLR